MKHLNDELQMRSDWLLPICSGGERLKDEEGHEGPPDPEARSPAPPRACCRDQPGGCGAGSVLRVGHDRRGRQAARPALDRDRAAIPPTIDPGAEANRRRPSGGRARTR